MKTTLMWPIDRAFDQIMEALVEEVRCCVEETKSMKERESLCKCGCDTSQNEEVTDLGFLTHEE